MKRFELLCMTATCCAVALAIASCSGAGGAPGGDAGDGSPSANDGSPQQDVATRDGSDASGGTDGMSDGPVMVDLSAYYQAYAVIGCQKSFDCCNDFGDDVTIAQNWRGSVTTRAGCTKAVIPSALAADEGELEKDIANGTIVYNAQYQQACLDAMAQLSCDHFFDDPELYTPAPCVSLFEGKLPLGATCTVSVQCAGGAGCIGPLSGTHTCQTIPQQGQSCTGYCPAHLYCDQSTSPNTCVPQLPEGSSCDPAQLQCQGICYASTNTCGPPLPKACEGTAGCSPGTTECMGNAVITCASDGTWGTNPAPCTDQACVGGVCSGYCAPSTTVVCNGNQPQTCDATGNWQNAGPACVQPTPDCTGAGTCTCLETLCSGQCVDTQSDPNNCGGCGLACSIGTCTLGRCIATLVSGQNAVMGLATDGTNVYWTDLGSGAANNGTVNRIPVGGGTPSVVASGLYGPFGLALAGSQVVFTDTYWVKSVPDIGGNVTTMASGEFEPYVAILGANAYFLDGNPGSLDVAPIGAAGDGGVGTTLVTPITPSSAIAVDANNVYFGSGLAPTGLMKAPLSGGSAVMLSPGPPPSNAVSDGTNVYWTTDSGGTVLQIPVGGGTATTLASNQPNPSGIAVSGGYVYWANWYGGGSVHKMPIGGGTDVTLMSGTPLNSYGSLALDATSVYVATNTSVIKITPK